MSKLDPRAFKFALFPQFLEDPEVTYLEDEDGWVQWDLAEVLFNKKEELYEARP
jgi:hypothetical protein